MNDGDGYTVLEAGAVDEAAQHTASADVDVILLDIRMGEGLDNVLTLLDRLPAEPFALDDLATAVHELATR